MNKYVFRASCAKLDSKCVLLQLICYQRKENKLTRTQRLNPCSGKERVIPLMLLKIPILKG